MIVVAIVAILAAIAYPNYTEYVRRSRRADAQTYLMDAAQRQQHFLLDARRYATTLPELFGVDNDADVVPDDVDQYYTVTVTANTATRPNFTITATPISDGMQAQDAAGVMTIDQTGNKTPSDYW